MVTGKPVFGAVLLVLLTIFAQAACVSFTVPPGVNAGALVHGRVMLGGDPMAGAAVGAYRKPDFGRLQPVASAVTDDDGYYSLDVGPGTYYLAVFDSISGRFAYSGLNPVRLGEGMKMRIGFLAHPVKRASYVPWEEGSAAVGGVIKSGDGPLEGARVFAYLDAGEDFRGPGYAFSLPTGDDGRFIIADIPPGAYYLVVRKRTGKGLVGPVESGDCFGYFPYNPIEVRDGRVAEVEMSCVVKKKELFPSSGSATVEGTLTDDGGRPLAGVYAFAYTEEVVGHKKPAATSRVTGPDGRYSLSLPGGGVYYIGARREYGINPQPGEWYGLYPGTPDHSIVIGEGEKKQGVDMVLEKILGWDE